MQTIVVKNHKYLKIFRLHLRARFLKTVFVPNNFNFVVHLRNNQNKIYHSCIIIVVEYRK